MQKLKALCLALTISLSGLGVLGLSTVSAVSLPASSVASLQGDACSGLTQVNSSQDCSTGGSGINKIIKAVVEILSIVVGVAAVIMIIVAGFKYITSSGDSNNISSAKTTLVYALVGIAIAVLAQFLVHFVLNAAARSVTSGS